MRIEAKRGDIHLCIETKDNFTTREMKKIDKHLVESEIDYYVGCYATATPESRLVLKFHPYFSLSQLEEVRQIVNGNGKQTSQEVYGESVSEGI